MKWLHHISMGKATNHFRELRIDGLKMLSNRCSGGSGICEALEPIRKKNVTTGYVIPCNIPIGIPIL